MLFWALLAAGQIVMRKVDGWQTLTHYWLRVFRPLVFACKTLKSRHLCPTT
jgi:hypothetical protein